MLQGGQHKIRLIQKACALSCWHFLAWERKCWTLIPFLMRSTSSGRYHSYAKVSIAAKTWNWCDATYVRWHIRPMWFHLLYEIVSNFWCGPDVGQQLFKQSSEDVGRVHPSISTIQLKHCTSIVSAPRKNCTEHLMRGQGNVRSKCYVLYRVIFDI